MDAISLKKYIFKNEKVEYVLEKIGCHSIQYHSNKEFWSCANFDGDNVSAINVKNNEYLNVRNWTRKNDFDDDSDIITLVEYNKKITFSKAVKYLHEILGLEYKFQKSQSKAKDKIEPLNTFKKYKSKSKVNVDDIHELDEDLLNDFVPMLYIGWFREGVMPWTAKKFGLAYSYKKRRVVIPMRHHKTGKLLGINSRTTIENYEELGITKFFITPSYQKSLNIFGLYENREAIKKAGYVVVYEAEKSVSKSKNTPYDKFTFGARVTDVFVKGNYIVENCNLKG